MFFRKKRLVATHEAEWIAEQFAWFSKQLGPDWLQENRLILPTVDFFDSPKGQGHDTADQVFRRIKSHMGMDDSWPAELVAHEAAPTAPNVADTVAIEGAPNPILGTFRMAETGAVITYDPGLLASPKSFISTMAHELAHYVILSQPAQETWKETPMLEEMTTDLFVIAAGFGVFKLESITSSAAYQSPYAQGWSISHSGYISPEFAAMGLAFFLRLNAIPADDVTPHISRLSQKRLIRALAQLDADPELLDIARDAD